MIGGLLLAHQGFSGLAMMVNLPANLLIVVWMVSLGTLMWRRHEAPRTAVQS